MLILHKNYSQYDCISIIKFNFFVMFCIFYSTKNTIFIVILILIKILVLRFHKNNTIISFITPAV